MKIADILMPDRVAVGLALTSKKAVLEKLANMLATADPALKPQEVFDSLLARERLGTTGLGAGIAIPHGRVAISGKPAGAFLRTAKPLDFDAVDNAPVDLFFALFVPKNANQEHLDLLAALATRFSERTFVERLRAAGSAAEAFAYLTEAHAVAR